MAAGHHEAAYCFFPSADHVWGLGTVAPDGSPRADEAHRTVVDEETGEAMRMKRSELLMLGALEQPKNELLDMARPHEAVVMHWLKARLAARRYGTRLGRLLLQFPTDQAEPVSSVPAESYARCMAGEGDQAIAVLGTAASEKHAYTAASLKALLRCGAAHRAQLDAATAGMHVLRWFGGVRAFAGGEIPCHSSRWEVAYDAGGRLSTVHVAVGGLERSRILSVTDSERLFSAAYMLLAGRDASKYLAASTTFPQIADGVPPDARDKLDYEACNAALQQLGADARTRDSLWRAVSASLHIGALDVVTEDADPDAMYTTTPKNGWAGQEDAGPTMGPWGDGAHGEADRMGADFLSFLSKSGTSLGAPPATPATPEVLYHQYVSETSTQSLRQAAGLLGVPPGVLERAMCSTENAAVARDVLACAVYSAAFEEAVAVVNRGLSEWPAAGSGGRSQSRDRPGATLTEKFSQFRSSLRHKRGDGASTPRHSQRWGSPSPTPPCRSPGSAASPPARGTGRGKPSARPPPATPGGGARGRSPSHSPDARCRGTVSRKNPIADAWGEGVQTPRGEGVDAHAQPYAYEGETWEDEEEDEEADVLLEPYRVRIVDLAGPQDAHGGCCGVEELLRHAAYEVVESRYREEVLTKPPVEASLETPRGRDAGEGVAGCPGPSSDDVLGTLLSPETGWLAQIQKAADDQQLYNILLAPPVAGALAFSVKVDDDADEDALPVVFQHTFGPVKYDVCGFTAGMAPPPPQLVALMGQAALRPVRKAAALAGGSLFARQSGFQQEVVDVLSTAGAGVAWVRCLAASGAKGYWNGAHVAAQLRHAGVMSALHFGQRSHDVFIPHAEFLRRFRVLSTRAVLRRPATDAALARRRCGELLAEVSVPGLSPSLSVGATAVLLRTPALRALQGKAAARTGDVLLAFLKGLFAARRAQRHDPAARIKAQMRQSRKTARVEMSRRHMLLRDEARYRCFLAEQFSKKAHFLSERRARSLFAAQTKQTQALLEKEDRQRRCLVSQSDAWYRARREEHARAQRAPSEGTAPSTVYSAVPIPDLEGLAQQVSTQVIGYHSKVHEMAKMSKSVVHEAKLRAAEEEKYRRAMVNKEVEDQRRRRVLEEKRLEREARAREVQQTRDAARARAQHAHQQQMLSRGKQREHERARQQQEVEARTQARAWEAFQTGALKEAEEGIAQEKRRQREQIRLEVEQKKKEEAERVQRMQQQFEMKRLRREQKEKEDAEEADRQRRKDSEAAFQESIRLHKAQQKRDAAEKKKRRVEFERRTLASQSLRTLTVAPEAVMDTASGVASPIRARRTEDGRWVPLSQRLGLLPPGGTPLRARPLTKPVRALDVDDAG